MQEVHASRLLREANHGLKLETSFVNLQGLRVTYDSCPGLSLIMCAFLLEPSKTVSQGENRFDFHYSVITYNLNVR